MNSSNKIGISLCLLGEKCRWDGRSKKSKKALNLICDKKYIGLCPEKLANLPTPRVACEIVGGDGFDILKGKAKIIGSDGKDYTKIYVEGAQKALKIIQEEKIKKVILKSGSPSCGSGTIYDGSFTGNKKNGYGILAALLKKNKIKLIEI